MTLPDLRVSPLRRREILDALRRGTVPRDGLELLAVGLDRFERAVGDELSAVQVGGAVFKAVRGEYGSGKTFFARWLQDRARRMGLATAEVQISESETPLHRIETVYRRLVERLATSAVAAGALRSVVDTWCYRLEEQVLAGEGVDERDTNRLLQRTNELMETRLAAVTRVAPMFATALRGYRTALAAGDEKTATSLLAWLGGQPQVGAAAKRAAGIRGDVDHFAALGFLQGLLVILREAGFPGLVVVLDELETLQRVRGDIREKSLNALRQILDELDGGRFPGLYLIATGTPSFFEGPMGVQRLQPLAGRLQVDFATDERFDNPRAVQIRLRAFDLPQLEEVGRRVRALYRHGADAPERIDRHADDDYIATLARAVAGQLGGRCAVAPRLFLKKLVGEVLDRIDQFPDFDPRTHYAPTLDRRELSDVERQATSPDDVELDLSGS